MSELIDGDLDDSVCQEIERHLRSCDNCRIMVVAPKKTIVLYRDEPLQPIPHDVHERLVTVLKLEKLKRKD